jgi:hypothetical protein
MDVGSILVILAMFILVAGFLARPLLEKRGFSVTQGSRHLSELQTERDKILLILQELDMDHAMGKIPTQDYESQRPGLVARGAAILREIDELGGPVFAPASVKTTSQEGQDLDAMMEEEILRRRKPSSVEPVGFCTKCGNRIQEGDRFCTSCGTKVQVAEKKA